MNATSRKKLILKLKNKKYRDAYVSAHVRNGIPYQIRALRDQRGWTQGELGKRARKPQNVISRLEDPSYGKMSTPTLLELASAFDVALLIKFVPFSRFLREVEDLSPEALSARGFEKEIHFLEAENTESSVGVEYVATGSFLSSRDFSLPSPTADHITDLNDRTWSSIDIKEQSKGKGSSVLFVLQDLTARHLSQANA